MEVSLKDMSVTVSWPLPRGEPLLHALPAVSS